jgi:hypothetical protein
MGYGIAINSDHFPWTLLPWASFKNNPNNVGNLNNQSETDLTIPLNNTKNTSTSNVNSKENSNPTKSDNSNQVSTDPPNAKISTSQAEAIATKYILEPGTITGSAQNVDIGGKNTYVVPVKSNGKTVGEIDIDPQTGKNVGGAGGAPQK